MDAMARMYQEQAADAHKCAVAARDRWDFDVLLMHQRDQAHAFIQSWLWRFGNVMDLDEANG